MHIGRSLECKSAVTTALSQNLEVYLYICCRVLFCFLYVVPRLRTQVEAKRMDSERVTEMRQYDTNMTGGPQTPACTYMCAFMQQCVTTAA